MHEYRSVCRYIVLGILADVVREALDKCATELIVIEDVTAPWHTLGLLIVHLDPEEIFA